jgi:hypothetical protein
MTPTPAVRTPFYAANHADRVHRQACVAKLEAAFDAHLICYVGGIDTQIERNDTLGFCDLLHRIPKGSNVDLLLHTPGGEIDAAEKLMSLVRAVAVKGRLRVIVPDFAKSAGTLMALAADKIVMSDASELGPIDPQVVRHDSQGNLHNQSVLNYLDAYEEHAASLRSNPSDPVAQMMLDKLDPVVVKKFQTIRDRARRLAEVHLKQGMFKAVPGNYTKIASDLMDLNRWQSHGQMISRHDAADIGLVVEHVDPNLDTWGSCWELYCLQRLAIKDGQKLFESSSVSLIW